MHDKHDHDKHIDGVRPIILDLQEIFMEALRAAVSVGGAIGCALGLFAFLTNL